MPVDTITAAILAGGAARRFGGQDKSRLIVDGRPIIVRQIEVLQCVASDVIVIGGPLDRFADLHQPVYADLLPGCGALGGVYTALEVAAHPRVLVVAGDLPYLDHRVLARLAELAVAADGAWIRSARGVEPLLACYRRDVRATVRAEIEAGRMKVADLGRVLHMAEITVAELTALGASERVLANVNTPEDLRRLQ